MEFDDGMYTAKDSPQSYERLFDKGRGSINIDDNKEAFLKFYYNGQEHFSKQLGKIELKQLKDIQIDLEGTIYLIGVDKQYQSSFVIFKNGQLSTPLATNLYSQFELEKNCNFSIYKNEVDCNLETTIVTIASTPKYIHWFVRNSADKFAFKSMYSLK